MIEERRGTPTRCAGADAGFEHHLERMTRIPSVDEVDVRTGLIGPRRRSSRSRVTGDPMRFVLPGVIQPSMCRSSPRIVRWSWMTPFGSLVVPDVYASTATEVASTPAAGRRLERREDVPPHGESRPLPVGILIGDDDVQPQHARR